MKIYVVFCNQLIGNALVKAPVCAVNDEGRAISIFHEFTDKLKAEKRASEYATGIDRVRELHAIGWFCRISLEEVAVW